MQSLKYVIPAGLLLGILCFVYSANIAKATPPTFVRTTATAAATTSPVYMTPGTATTSVTYDAYANYGTGVIEGNLNVNIGVQFTGSSTAASICRATAYSNDGIDYYFANEPVTTGATTTNSVGSFRSDCWNFASTSPTLGAVTSATSTTNKIISIAVLARYTKVFFYIPSGTGSTNGALWAEAIGIKSQN